MDGWVLTNTRALAPGRGDVRAETLNRGKHESLCEQKNSCQRQAASGQVVCGNDDDGEVVVITL